jgi:Lrp/AsnC family leucine-responsive transcriptional regulator
MRTKTNSIKELDKIDLMLLALLQQDAKLSITELAEKVNLSITPCSERIKHLEKEGYILGYHAKLNPHKLNLGLLVFVEIKLSSKSNEIFHQFKKDVLKLPHVLECHLLSGDFDYLVKARISEISHYRELLGETLLSLPYARESRSYMVMEEVKENFILPVS